MEPITQAAQVRSYSSSRRSQIRYPLRTPVIYRWLDNNGLQRRARGWTRDISEAGAYVLSSHCPQKGDVVELKFKLLALREQRTPRGNEHLEMGGEVVRVDVAKIAGEAVGFAVRSKTPAAAKQADELSQRSWLGSLGMGAVCN
ncbi:MAG TPA: PilZ domain-containing protein [Candidatus Acidoferrum sp.]|nr:PilZ domain-containing protein [Candidatus Acidoferrum sp.]